MTPAYVIWWDAWDSNPESTGYEPGALTNYANVPNKKKRLMIKYIINFTISRLRKRFELLKKCSRVGNNGASCWIRTNDTWVAATCLRPDWAKDAYINLSFLNQRSHSWNVDMVSSEYHWCISSVFCYRSLTLALDCIDKTHYAITKRFLKGSFSMLTIVGLPTYPHPS